MTLAYQGIGGLCNAPVGQTTLTMVEPASSLANDMLVCIIAYRSNTQWVVPSGWTKRLEENLGDTVTTSAGIASIMVADIVRGSSAPSLVFTRAATGEITRAYIVSLRGGGGTPTYETGSSATLGAAAVTATAPSITTGGAGRVIIAGTSGIRGNNAVNWSAQGCATDPIAITERGDASASTAPTISISASASSQGAAGATGALSATCVFSGRHAAALLSYYEAGGAGPPRRSRAMVYG